MPKRARKTDVEQPTQSQEALPPPGFRVDDYNPSKTRLLYVSVTVFVIIMAVIWGWSLKQQILTFQWSNSSEVKLVTDAQKTWNTIYQEQTEKENAYVDVKSSLQKIIQSVVAASSSIHTSSSTSASSTLPTSTTAITVSTTNHKK